MARARYDNNAFTPNGAVVQIVPYAEITVYEKGSTTLTLVDTLFADITGPTTKGGNPFNADQYGNFSFYLDNKKRVNIKVTGTGMGTVWLEYAPVMPDPEEMVVTGDPNIFTPVQKFGVGDFSPTDGYLDTLGHPFLYTASHIVGARGTVASPYTNGDAVLAVTAIVNGPSAGGVYGAGYFGMHSYGNYQATAVFIENIVHMLSTDHFREGLKVRSHAPDSAGLTGGQIQAGVFEASSLLGNNPQRVLGLEASLYQFDEDRAITTAPTDPLHTPLLLSHGYNVGYNYGIHGSGSAFPGPGSGLSYTSDAYAVVNPYSPAACNFGFLVPRASPVGDTPGFPVYWAAFAAGCHTAFGLYLHEGIYDNAAISIPNNSPMQAVYSNVLYNLIKMNSSGEVELGASGRNLKIPATGMAVVGDFSNATLVNRNIFQSASGNTSFTIRPASGSTQALFEAYSSFAMTDILGSFGVWPRTSTPGEVRISANDMGGGSPWFAIRTSFVERFNISPAGIVTVVGELDTNTLVVASTSTFNGDITLNASPWVAWTPTVTQGGALTAMSANSGHYRVFGKTAIVEIETTVVTATGAAGSNAVIITNIPAAIQPKRSGNESFSGVFAIFKTGTGYYFGQGYNATATALAGRGTPTAGGDAVLGTAASPFSAALVANDKIMFSGTWEIN